MKSSESAILGPIRMKQALEQVTEYVRAAVDYGERRFYVPQKYRDSFDDEIAEENLRDAWSLVISLLEATGQDFLLKTAYRELEESRKDPLKSRMGPEEPFLVWPWKVQKYAELLTAMYVQKSTAEMESEPAQLIEILQRCEKYLVLKRLFAWPPCSEADVHDRIEELLACYYPGLKRKPRLNKPIKNFEPDTGLPSLKTLIEYKYITSTEEAKRVVDELLADIGGYKCREYNRFVFVIYETGRFERQDEWKDALKGSNTPSSVHTVLLKGVEPTPDDRKRAAGYRTALKKNNKKAKT